MAPPPNFIKKKLWPEQTIDDDLVLCNKLLCMNANQKNQLYYMHAVTKYIVMIKSDKKIILYADHDRLLQTIKYVVITILNLVRTLMSILIFQNNDYRVLAQEAHDNSTETIQSPVTSSLLSHYLCGTSSSYESSCSSIDQT
jgi:c-di-AMP phosphodiesterase-like protein